jgi:hypothetical protein
MPRTPGSSIDREHARLATGMPRATIASHSSTSRAPRDVEREHGEADEPLVDLDAEADTGIAEVCAEECVLLGVGHVVVGIREAGEDPVAQHGDGGRVPGVASLRKATRCRSRGRHSHRVPGPRGGDLRAAELVLAARGERQVVDEIDAELGAGAEPPDRRGER